MGKVAVNVKRPKSIDMMQNFWNYILCNSEEYNSNAEYAG